MRNEKVTWQSVGSLLVDKKVVYEAGTNYKDATSKSISLQFCLLSNVLTPGSGTGSLTAGLGGTRVEGREIQ